MEQSVRFLVSSDLHGRTSAFANFAYLLKSDAFDAGIIAGDLLDDGVPDDFLPELPFHDETTCEYPDRQLGKLHTPDDPYVRANQYKQDSVRELLCSAAKPIYVICGNHDQTLWADGGCIVNIHERRVDVGSVNLVGYRWIQLERGESDRARDARALQGLIDSSTILVTHEPPYGILDEAAEENLFEDSIPTANVLYGSRLLLDLVRETVPRLHVFGRVHSQFGVQGRFINAAYPRRRAFLGVDACSSEVTTIDEAPVERARLSW